MRSGRVRDRLAPRRLASRRDRSWGGPADRRPRATGPRSPIARWVFARASATSGKRPNGTARRRHLAVTPPTPTTLRGVLAPGDVIRLEGDAVVMLDQRALPRRARRSALRDRPMSCARRSASSRAWRAGDRRRGGARDGAGGASVECGDGRGLVRELEGSERSSPPRARPRSISAGRSSAATAHDRAVAAAAGRTVGARARAAGAAHPRGRAPRCRAIGAPRRRAAPDGRARAHPLQRRRARHLRLRHGARRRARRARASGALHVWVDETRPLLQGARLTAWELARGRHPAHADRRRHGRAADRARPRRRRGGRRRPHRRQRRRREQDRHVRARGAGRAPTACRSTSPRHLHDRPRHRQRRARSPSRSAPRRGRAPRRAARLRRPASPV